MISKAIVPTQYMKGAKILSNCFRNKSYPTIKYIQDIIMSKNSKVLKVAENEGMYTYSS